MRILLNFSISILVLFLISPVPLFSQEKKESIPPAPVVVGEVTKKSVSDKVTLIGTVESIRSSDVASEVQGIVESYPVKKGLFVEKDQILAMLRTRATKLRLKQAVAERETILARFKRAEKELKRVSKLWETKSVAEKIFDDAYFEHLALSKQLQASSASIDIIEYNLGQKTVKAPFAGVVVEEHTQVGEWIIGGGPIVTLMDLSNIYVTVDVPQRYVLALEPGDTVSIIFKNLPNATRQGEIESVLPMGDASARTFPVRVIMENPNSKIMAGMEAFATFSLPGSENMLLIPKDAVVTSGEARMVYKVTGDSVTPVPIKILGYYGENAAIDGELAPGTPVVIRGNERLRPGQQVKVTNK